MAIVTPDRPGCWTIPTMRVSAKADYAIRAAAELATADPAVPLKAERIAEAQDIPIKFLETILLELKHAGIVRSQRGPDGGYALARPARGSASRTSSGPSTARSPTSAATDPRTRPIPGSPWAAHGSSGSPCGRRCGRSSRTRRLADLARASCPNESAQLAADPEAWLSLGRIRGPGRAAMVAAGAGGRRGSSTAEPTG